MYFCPSYPSSYNMWSAQNSYNSPYKTLDKALTLIQEAIEDERKDELFYDYLTTQTPNKEQTHLIMSIRDDEQKHNKMFREIYYSLTGKKMSTYENEYFNEPKTYVDGLTQALFGELAAVEKYRDIRAGLPIRYYQDMLFEIITDEIKHSAQYNYLLTLNSSSGLKGLLRKLKFRI